MTRAALAVAAVVAIAVAAAMAMRVPVSPAAPVPAPAATRPASFTVNGWTYDCAQVRQLVEAGEWYTPDGHYIYAVLLMDCDV